MHHSSLTGGGLHLGSWYPGGSPWEGNGRPPQPDIFDTMGCGQQTGGTHPTGVTFWYAPIFQYIEMSTRMEYLFVYVPWYISTLLNIYWATHGTFCNRANILICTSALVKYRVSKKCYTGSNLLNGQLFTRWEWVRGDKFDWLVHVRRDASISELTFNSLILEMLQNDSSVFHTTNLEKKSQTGYYI